MRRTAAIRLTLLPLLASASLARAQEERPPQSGPQGVLCDGTDPSDPDCDRERRRAGAELLNSLPTIVQDQFHALCPADQLLNGVCPTVMRHGFGYYFWAGG
jgi:hypothetical protein